MRSIDNFVKELKENKEMNRSQKRYNWLCYWRTIGGDYFKGTRAERRRQFREMWERIKS